MPRVAYSEEERERIRVALVRVALDLMTKQGIQHTTVEQIYRRVGISRTFFYGFVHGSKTKIGNLLVGWNEESQTIVVVPTVPDLSGCGEPVYYRRSEILKAYRNKYPTDAFIIYPDKKSYIGIHAYDWLEDETLYVYVSQEKELAAFTEFFMNCFATK